MSFHQRWRCLVDEVYLVSVLGLTLSVTKAMICCMGIVRSNCSAGVSAKVMSVRAVMVQGGSLGGCLRRVSGLFELVMGGGSAGVEVSCGSVGNGQLGVMLGNGVGWR